MDALFELLIVISDGGHIQQRRAEGFNAAMRYSTVCQPRRKTVQGWPVLNISDLLIILSFLI